MAECPRLRIEALEAGWGAGPTSRAFGALCLIIFVHQLFVRHGELRLCAGEGGLVRGGELAQVQGLSSPARLSSSEDLEVSSSNRPASSFAKVMSAFWKISGW